MACRLVKSNRANVRWLKSDFSIFTVRGMIATVKITSWCSRRSISANISSKDSVWCALVGITSKTERGGSVKCGRRIACQKNTFRLFDLLKVRNLLGLLEHGIVFTVFFFFHWAILHSDRPSRNLAIFHNSNFLVCILVLQILSHWNRVKLLMDELILMGCMITYKGMMITLFIGFAKSYPEGFLLVSHALQYR